MKLLALALIAAIAFAAIYAGSQAVRTWRTSVAVRSVRLRGADE